MATTSARVALVEEDPQRLPALRRLLDEHFLVDGYGGGATALAGVRRHLPDVLLLSTGILDVPWREALAQLPAELPVIALSTCTDEAEREHCLSLGCADHLIKPILDGELLLSAVLTCLDPGSSAKKRGPNLDRDRDRKKRRR